MNKSYRTASGKSQNALVIPGRQNSKLPSLYSSVSDYFSSSFHFSPSSHHHRQPTASSQHVRTRGKESQDRLAAQDTNRPNTVSRDHSPRHPRRRPPHRHKRRREAVQDVPRTVQHPPHRLSGFRHNVLWTFQGSCGAEGMGRWRSGLRRMIQRRWS